MNINFLASLKMKEEIKVLGVSGHTDTDHMVNNVEKALVSLSLTHLKPTIVDDISQVMDYRVGSIPALVIREQVVAQRYIPPTSSLQQFFRTLFLPNQNKVNMKNILFPTDFSETSKNAFAFAKALAGRQGASIKAVHVHYPDATALENVPVDMFEETLKIKRERINRFTGQEATTAEEGNLDVLTKIETDIMIGFPGDTIVSLSKQEDVDLIVMGTTGEGGFLEKVFGTVSTHVSKKAGCPVLLIPDGVEFKECSNILFATDEKATDQVLVERVPDIMGCPKADVHFVHVNEVDRPSYRVEDLCFKNPALTGQFHFVQIESKDILEGLNRYTKEENIDAMIMATPRRSFLEGLFHKSMTKQMALNTQMPLLVMHYGD